MWVTINMVLVWETYCGWLSLGGVSFRVGDSCCFLGRGVRLNAPRTPPPGNGKIWPFLGRLKVFRPFSRMVQAPDLKKKKNFLLKKRRRIQQRKRKPDRTPLRWRINLTDQTYDTEEVYRLLSCSCHLLSWHFFFLLLAPYT